MRALGTPRPAVNGPHRRGAGVAGSPRPDAVTGALRGAPAPYYGWVAKTHARIGRLLGQNYAIMLLKTQTKFSFFLSDLPEEPGGTRPWPALVRRGVGQTGRCVFLGTGRCWLLEPVSGGARGFTRRDRPARLREGAGSLVSWSWAELRPPNLAGQSL